ncbi:phage tail protein [Paenisporosarcina macmurdoensis]|uniref:Phage tail protein n=1 Tax=Paenisporosarcina macmurdoensis TaxID=212659 RepID=A0ABW1L307_9BACL
MPPVTFFDAVSINNVGIQFKEGDTYEAGTTFGCVGSLEGESDVSEKQLKCGNQVLGSITKVNFMTFTVTAANAPLAVVRKLFGLENTGLKTGVYALGEKSKGKDFILTADIEDEFQDVTKMIAFPNASNITGLKIQAIENGADEVANLEFEFRALKDANGKFYYEAMSDEVVDSIVKEQWHTGFTPALVAEIETP